MLMTSASFSFFYHETNSAQIYSKASNLKTRNDVSQERDESRKDEKKGIKNLMRLNGPQLKQKHQSCLISLIASRGQ